MPNYRTGLYDVTVGFTSASNGGFLYNLDLFLTDSTGAGGANWYVVEDGSTIVDRTFAHTDVDPGTGNFTIAGHGFFDGQKISFYGPSMNGVSATSMYYARVISSSIIRIYLSQYNALNDISHVAPGGFGAGTYHAYNCPYKVYSNINSPVVNDNAAKIVEIWYFRASAGSGAGTLAGAANFTAFLWWNTTTHLGVGQWAGKALICFDNFSGVYSYRFCGDPNFFMCNNTATATAYPHLVVFDNWTTVPNAFESTSAIGTLASGITAGRAVTLTLGSGQASNFTAGKYYFIYDMNGHSYVDYVQVVSRNTGNDTIVVNDISFNFTTGSKIGSYPHRFYMSGLGWDGHYAGSGNVQYGCYYDTVAVPYMTLKTKSNTTYKRDKVFRNNNQINYQECYVEAFVGLNSDDNGNRYVQRPIISEYRDAEAVVISLEAKTIGILDHMYIINTTGLTAGVSTIDIGGISYLYINYLGSSGTFPFGPLCNLVSVSPTVYGILIQAQNG